MNESQRSSTNQAEETIGAELLIYRLGFLRRKRGIKGESLSGT